MAIPLLMSYAVLPARTWTFIICKSPSNQVTSCRAYYTCMYLSHSLHNLSLNEVGGRIDSNTILSRLENQKVNKNDHGLTDHFIFLDHFPRQVIQRYCCTNILICFRGWNMDSRTSCPDKSIREETRATFASISLVFSGMRIWHPYYHCPCPYSRMWHLDFPLNS